MQGDRATAPSAKPKPRKKPVVQAPGGDIASSGGDYGKGEADAYKKTKAYKGAVRTGYKGNQQPKQALADNIATARKGRASTEQQVVFKTHADSVRGNRKNAASRAGKDTKGNDDRQRALKFLADHPEILKPKADHKGPGGIGGAVLGVFHRVYGGGSGDTKKGSAVATAHTGSLGGASIRAATGGGLYAIPKNVGLVLAEDPKKQIPKLAGDTAKSIASIPAGIVASATHPKKALSAMAADYSHRYGDLARGDEQAFRDRLKKEGVAPEVFDIGAGVSAGGEVVGRGLQTAAKAGKLGEKAERVATVRPALRVSGNVTKEQPVSENFLRNATGAARDTARAKVQGRRAAHESAPLEVRQAQAAGEVTHIRKGATKRAQQKLPAGKKGRYLAQMKVEGQREEKAVRANIGSLTKPERRALNYAMKFGIHDADTARRELPGWIERVKAERAKHEAATGKKIPPKQNEVPELEYLLAHADEAFTPSVAAVAQEEGARAAAVAVEDHGVDNTAAERRRHIAQAELIGEARPLPKAEAQAHVREAKSAVTEAEKHLRRADGPEDVQAAEVALDEARATLKRAKKVESEGGYVVSHPGSAIPDGLVHPDDVSKFLDGAKYGATIHHGTSAKGLEKTGFDFSKAHRHTFGNGIYGSSERHIAEQYAGSEGTVHDVAVHFKKPLDIGTPESPGSKVFFDTRSEAYAYVREHHPELGNPSLDIAATKAAEKRLAAVLHERGYDGIIAGDEHVALTPHAIRVISEHAPRIKEGRHVVTASEFDAEHLPRVIEAARKRGLGEAAYTVSEKRPAGVFSAFGVGGTKAVAGAKRYEGALLRTGRESTSPEAHVLSIQKGIKRKHNWNLVADTFEEHAAPDLRNMTLDELRDELDRRGIDPDSVAFWNPGRYRQERQHFDKATDGGGEADIADPTFESRNVQDALGDSSLDDIHSVPSKFAGTNGWSVVPRAVYDEIHADIKPSGKIGRTYDIARGKVSRVLLAHPAWLQFQVASNALMTGLAGVGPVDAIKAQQWWKTLSSAERDAIEPYIGVTGWYDEQRHLGAASNAKIVNAYRAFKTTPFYRTAHKANPLDMLFRADHAQNNFFRKAVLYNRVKREAYANMGRESRKMVAAQHRIVDTMLGRSPEEAMRALLKDGRSIEQHAKAVNDFLGNWTTYTARERRGFARSVMFYGFLRFSVKLAFYTMPIEHPLMSSILLQMGHLQDDELQKLFGGDAPVWEIGSYHDHGHKFNLARLNPFFNSLQFQGPGSLIGSFGPMAQVIADQVAGKNVSFDKLFTVNGDTRYVGRAKDLSLADRLNIAAAELEKVSPYARMAERYKLKGRQTSDSWLLHPRGTGTPGLGEKSHDVGSILREGLAPITGENDKPSLDASKALNHGDLPSTADIISGKAPLPKLPKLPPLPRIP